VIEGPTLFVRSSLEKLRDLVIDLQLIDGTHQPFRKQTLAG
jgi:hypothetical protein